MINIKNNKIINYNLPLCFREIILEWYSGQLTILEKEGLRVNIKN